MTAAVDADVPPTPGSVRESLPGVRAGPAATPAQIILPEQPGPALNDRHGKRFQVHAFRFVNQAGAAQYVRYTLVPAVEYRDVASERFEETSAAIRERVIRARERQRERFHHDAKVTCNARMATRQLKQHCKLSQDSQELIRVAMSELNLSARAYDRILKVSRTIADLAGADAITPEHVSEAIQYRTFDRTLWV